MNLFPTYNSLATKNPEVGSKAVSQSLLTSFGLYVSISLLSIFMFGSTVQHSVIDNVYKLSWIPSLTIRLLFMLVLACHIPYVFFSGKESILVII